MSLSHIMAARAAHGGAAAKAAGLPTAEAAVEPTVEPTVEAAVHFGRLTAKALFRRLTANNRCIFSVSAPLRGRKSCGVVFCMHGVLSLPHIGNTCFFILFSLPIGRISFRRGICYGRSVLIWELSGLWFQWYASNTCGPRPFRL